MVTLHIFSRPAIFISDRSLAYQALILNGSVFGNRPSALATSRVLNSESNCKATENCAGRGLYL